MGRFGVDSSGMNGRARKVVVAVAVLAMLALPIGYVVASDTFPDVSSSAYYHDSVNALVNAGITAGCGSGKYCPNNAVTRGQMAVFLSKLGNLAGQNPVVDALTVFGQAPLTAEDEFTVVGGASVKTECQDSPRPLVPGSLLPYTITAQLEDGPVSTSLVNVSADDPDIEDETFKVCFSTVDGTDLTAGVYRVASTYTLFIGSGIFAGSARTNQAASVRAVTAWQK